MSRREPTAYEWVLATAAFAAVFAGAFVETRWLGMSPNRLTGVLGIFLGILAAELAARVAPTTRMTRVRMALTYPGAIAVAGLLEFTVLETAQALG